MNKIQQSLNEYRIPAYMEDILTHNYCPCFIRMTMVRDTGSYKFSYRPGTFMKIDTVSLSTYEKAVLLRSLINVNDRADSFLIKGNSYLLEPELIYSMDNRVTENFIRILFYPDVKKLGFRQKLIKFSERIRDNSRKEERELAEQFRNVAEEGDMNRIRLFLDKNISRMENRLMSKTH